MMKENSPRGYLISAMMISFSIHQSQTGQFLLKYLYFASLQVMPFGDQSVMDCFAYCLAMLSNAFDNKYHNLITCPTQGK